MVSTRGPRCSIMRRQGACKHPTNRCIQEGHHFQYWCSRCLPSGQQDSFSDVERHSGPEAGPWGSPPLWVDAEALHKQRHTSLVSHSNLRARCRSCRNPQTSHYFHHSHQHRVAPSHVRAKRWHSNRPLPLQSKSPQDCIKQFVENLLVHFS